jgi:hypothetical protein
MRRAGTAEAEQAKNVLSQEVGDVFFGHGRGKLIGALVCAVLVMGLGCDRSEAPDASLAGKASNSASLSASAPSASSSAPVAKIAEGVPIPGRQVERVVNPKREQAYAGPTGHVVGAVAVTGDEALEDPEWLEPIPKACLAAREAYKKLFREGMMRSVADVFVAVTGYKGYVPAREDAKLVQAKGCAFETRTVGLTYGQRLDIVSRDARSYVPELLGGRTTAQLVATPGGDPVQLFPQRPGRYILVDSMRTFAAVEVLVVAYATFDVTGLNGKFEIKDVPVGKVKLSALLPSAMLTAEQDIVVEAGKTLNVDLELKFDRAQYEKAEKDRAAAKAKPAAAKDSSAPAASAKP